LDLFWRHRKKTQLQLARNQQFARGRKMRALYDRDELKVNTIVGNLLCNLLMMNLLCARSWLFKIAQILVNNITCPLSKAKNARF
jgi:hypothetical protein